MTLFDFSSKHSFEEESKSIDVTMKLSEPWCVRASFWPAWLYWTCFRDQIDEFLNLMTKDDFYPLKDQTLTIVEFGDY